MARVVCVWSLLGRTDGCKLIWHFEYIPRDWEPRRRLLSGSQQTFLGSKGSTTGSVTWCWGWKSCKERYHSHWGIFWLPLRRDKVWDIPTLRLDLGYGRNGTELYLGTEQRNPRPQMESIDSQPKHLFGCQSSVPVVPQGCISVPSTHCN